MGFRCASCGAEASVGLRSAALRGKCGGCGCAAYRHSPVAHSAQALPTLSVRDMHLFAAKMCWPDDLADQVGGPPSSGAPLWPLCRTPRAPPWPLYLAAISLPGSITHARPSSPHDRSLRCCVLGCRRRMPVQKVKSAAVSVSMGSCHSMPGRLRCASARPSADARMHPIFLGWLAAASRKQRSTPCTRSAPRQGPRCAREPRLSLGAWRKRACMNALLFVLLMRARCALNPTAVGRRRCGSAQRNSVAVPRRRPRCTSTHAMARSSTTHRPARTHAAAYCSSFPALPGSTLRCGAVRCAASRREQHALSCPHRCLQALGAYSHAKCVDLVSPPVPPLFTPAAPAVRHPAEPLHAIPSAPSWDGARVAHWRRGERGHGSGRR